MVGSLQRAAADMKKFYDWKQKPEEFQVGEQVWLSMKDISTGQPKKKPAESQALVVPRASRAAEVTVYVYLV